MFKIKNIKKSKIAAVAIGTAVKVLTAVVCGAVVLTGTYGVVKHTVLPTSTVKTKSMFAYEGGADTGGGSGGSAGDNPVYETEIKRLSGAAVPEGAKYTKWDGTVLAEFPNVPGPTDTYEEGDYVYKKESPADATKSGWVVKSVKDKTKSEYGPILSEIAGIPVISLNNTFNGCTSLTVSPYIPESVELMQCTFMDCTSLVKAPAIPNNVTNLFAAFSNCTSITGCSKLPENVDDLRNAFEGCTSLAGAIQINANPDKYNNCFAGTTKPITLTGSSTKLAELAATANNGNVTVK